MKRDWKIKTIPEKFKNKSVIEKLLALRGIEKEEDAKEFLNPYDIELSNPNVFSDMQKAVERISKAINENEKILVYGDFDADGVTSTSVLLKTFKELNANISHFIPNRETEGHGLNSKALVKIMTTEKPKLIITVDCGISNFDEVNFINSFKIDVIITDHHEAPEILPKALAIINPKSPEALDENLSAKQILSLTSHAGVGVAFKLAQALLIHYDKTAYINELLPFVAVGTVADLVPLIGENRYYVAKGLELISAGKHYGLKRLLENAGYDLANGITSEQIAFGVAPRINASGRLETVDDALKVMVSENKQEIEMAIMSLEQLNKVRQELCENIFFEADEMLKKEGNKHDAIVLFNPKWHLGIIGIVASKFVEKYYKPAFLMTYSEETKQIRCSARGIEEVNIYDVLAANSDLFDGYGGHAMAGGLSFNVETVSFENVKKAINKTVSEILNGQKLNPTLRLDLELTPNDISGNLISDIERLQPFGAENPNPIFAMYNLKLLQKKLMGSNKNHLKLTVEDFQNNTYDCIWWSKGDISLNSGDTLDIAFCPQLNTYNGNTTIQFILQDIHSDNLVYEDEQSANPPFKIYDHRKKTGIFSNVEDYVKTSNLKIGIFAEDKCVKAYLKPYKAIYERIFNRYSEENFDAIMFFDYPASQEIFDDIIEKFSPKFIHFMNYETKNFDEKEYIKTINGMLKYAANTNNGEFNIKRASSYLALTNNIVEDSLNIFEKAKIIKIKNKSSEVYNIEFLGREISNVLHVEEYSLLLNDVKMIKDFKDSFSDADLSNFINFTAGY